MGLAIKRICVAPLAGNLDMVVYLAPWINYNGLVLFGLLLFQKKLVFPTRRHQVEGGTALRICFRVVSEFLSFVESPKSSFF